MKSFLNLDFLIQVILQLKSMHFSAPLGSSDIMQDIDAFNSASEAKQLIKDLSGIRVYRDGFVIRTAHDWLKLGEGQTSEGHFMVKTI